MRKQTKKALNLANILENSKPQAGDVLISSFLPSTDGQGSEQRHFNSQAEGQDSLRQAIIYWIIVTKSNGKEVEETATTWSQNRLLPATARTNLNGHATLLDLFLVKD